jgi:hypothetical protein
MPKFMDVHHGMVGITAEALVAAHAGDLAIESLRARRIPRRLPPAPRLASSRRRWVAKPRPVPRHAPVLRRSGALWSGVHHLGAHG